MSQAYDSHEGGDARSLDLKNVIVSSDREIMASKIEGNVWQTVTLVTLNSVLSIVSLLGTHLLVEEIGKGLWKSNQRGSGVKYDTSVVELSSRIAKAD